MKQSNTKTLVKIPFSGFYNSIHDSVIDSALEYEAGCYADNDKINELVTLLDNQTIHGIQKEYKVFDLDYEKALDYFNTVFAKHNMSNDF